MGRGRLGQYRAMRALRLVSVGTPAAVGQGFEEAVAPAPPDTSKSLPAQNVGSSLPPAEAGDAAR